jgi:hypothetical protein
MYTAQINAHGNVIVCKGDTVRNSYRIIFTGTYAACLMVKADQASRQVSFNDYTNRRPAYNAEFLGAQPARAGQDY